MSAHVKDKQDIVLVIIALGLTLSSIAGFIHIGPVYYVSMALLGIVLFFRSRGQIKIGLGWIICFLIAGFLSLLANNPPKFFNAWSRLGLYSVLLIIVSPLVSGDSIALSRKKLLEYIMLICVIISIGSLFAYFLGINFFDRGEGYLEISAGSFSGLMNHSIVLGHFAGLSTVYMVSKALSKNHKFIRLVYYLMGLLCFGACLLSASRNGIYSCVIACITIVICYYRQRILKGLFALLAFVCLAAITFPVWGDLTGFLIEKNANNVEMGDSIFFSRENKFNARIKEFESSPIFGIGFCTVNPQWDKVNYENGQVEPGSSWLAVGSMMGLVGMVPFLMICAISVKKAWKRRNRPESCLLSSLLFFYLVHLLSEGYLMAPRSFLAMVFWLLLGAIYAPEDAIMNPNQE